MFYICHDIIQGRRLFSQFTQYWRSSLPKEPCAFVLPITNGSSLWPKCQWSIRCRPRAHTGFITVVEVTPDQPTTKAHPLAQCRPCQHQQTLLSQGIERLYPKSPLCTAEPPWRRLNGSYRVACLHEAECTHASLLAGDRRTSFGDPLSMANRFGLQPSGYLPWTSRDKNSWTRRNFQALTGTNELLSIVWLCVTQSFQHEKWVWKFHKRSEVTFPEITWLIVSTWYQYCTV